MRLTLARFTPKNTQKKSRKPQEAGVTHRGDEVRGSGGHSGPGGGRRVAQRFGQEGPHHSVAGEEQPPTEQPERNMELGKGHRHQNHSLLVRLRWIISIIWSDQLLDFISL